MRSEPASVDLWVIELVAELRRGSPLPTGRALAERLGCSIVTASAIIGEALQASTHA